MKLGILAILFAGLLLVGLPLASTAGPAPDMDSDTVPDVIDNCKTVPNAAPLDCDVDQDGYGNWCDCDFDQNFSCNAADFNNPGNPAAPQFLPAFNPPPLAGASVEDMDCNLTVNAADFSNAAEPLGGFLNGFNGTGGYIAPIPGPSGLPCAGNVPCSP
jgi:hypothetical protein